jgi:hypothetical protein
MTPDLLKFYLESIKKISQRDIVQALKKRGIAVSQVQVSHTLTGARRNDHLRPHIEAVIELPGAFDDEFDLIAELRRSA